MQISQTRILAPPNTADGRKTTEPDRSHSDGSGSDAVFSLVHASSPEPSQTARGLDGTKPGAQTMSEAGAGGLSKADAARAGIPRSGEDVMVGKNGTPRTPLENPTPSAATNGVDPADSAQLDRQRRTAIAVGEGQASNLSTGVSSAQQTREMAATATLQPGQPGLAKQDGEPKSRTKSGGGSNTSVDGMTRTDSATASPSDTFQITATVGPAQFVDEITGLQDVFGALDDAPLDVAGMQVRDGYQSAQASRAAPDLPRLISAQLVDIARNLPDKPIELTLNPEELGRVRMTFQTDSSSMNVVLQVERPETLELMRRHIEQLAHDMRALGYDDVSFAFQHKEGDAPPDGNTNQQIALHGDSDAGGDAGQPVSDIVHINIGEGSGLDIRL